MRHFQLSVSLQPFAAVVTVNTLSIAVGITAGSYCLFILGVFMGTNIVIELNIVCRKIIVTLKYGVPLCLGARKTDFCKTWAVVENIVIHTYKSLMYNNGFE